MWVLILTLLGSTPIHLNAFASYADCNIARERILLNFASVYPNDVSYKLDCKGYGRDGQHDGEL